MTETETPARTIDDILASIPEITWTMPAQAPDVTVLCGRDEILDHRLKCAARWLWSLTHDMYDSLEPTSDEWIANEMQNMRELLNDGQTRFGMDQGRWYILKTLGICQSWKSSSQAAEQAAG